MASTWTGNDSRKARAFIAPLLPAPCWRCGKTVHPTDRWHVGHVVDRALGGDPRDPANWAPEHGRCNESAGGRLAAAMRSNHRDAQQRVRPGFWAA